MNTWFYFQPLSADSRKFHHKRGRGRQKRTAEALVQSRQWQVRGEPPKPPSLSIIDFNSLTRGGLEQSQGKHRKRIHRRKRRSKKSAAVAPTQGKPEAEPQDSQDDLADVDDTSDSPWLRVPQAELVDVGYNSDLTWSLASQADLVDVGD